jgi:TolB-like protein
MSLVPGFRLGSYVILSPLGAGGMGEVYRARDSKLDRDVAIKVLPASVAGDPDALSRFEREAKAVAALSHPNILAIFDFGTQDGIAYAVTELLEGETLRGRLEAGLIPKKQAVDYGLQIAKGLSAAHERGVVHRDLKPENVFVTRDDHLKILDFGLAKRTEKVAPGEETSAPTASGHTEPGTVMGTVGYMSPEQVRGLPVDHRSDIFSFGAVLYELLSGKRAFRRDTAADTMSAILKEEPPELDAAGRSIPPLLDHTVRHCLEKDRDKRFQSARDIVFALGEASGPARGPARPAAGRKRVWLAAVALVAVAAIVGLFLAGRPEKPATAGVKRIAVLPFENLGATEDDYFADGMADEVRGKLTMLRGVQVIARASSTPYKKATKSPQEIAKELGVAYLLTATVRWQKREGSASRVIVRPELVEVSGSDAPASKWQEPFDAALTDVFQVQSDIASRVAQSLGIVLGAKESDRLKATPTQNLDAYEAFLKGEAAFRDRDAEYEAFQHYQRAVALDPGFARAWVGLGWVSSWLFGTEKPTAEFAEAARLGAERAMALAPESAGAHQALGAYRWMVLQDYEGALAQLEIGQRLAPSDVDLLNIRAPLEMNLGRWQAAVNLERQAESLDPRSVDAKIFLGTALLSLRRFDEAKTVLDQGIALAPEHLPMRFTKSNWFLSQGDLKSARMLTATSKGTSPSELLALQAEWHGAWFLDARQVELLLRLPPAAFNDDTASWALALTEAYSIRGDAADVLKYADELRKTIEERLRIAPRSPDSLAKLSLALAYLGRRKEAISQAEALLAQAPAPDGHFANWTRANLVDVSMIVGDKDRAISNLDRLLGAPSGLTRAILRISGRYDPLRSDPRFQKLIAGDP